MRPGRNSQIAFILLIPIFWFLSKWPVIFFGTIYGWDSVYRLFSIDRLIVFTTWQPGLQAILQVVHLISDTAVAYTATSALIACATMVSVQLLIYRLIGFSAAIFTAIFFFASSGWQLVGVAPYSEPLFILAVSLSIHCYLSNRTITAAALFVYATITRQELLIAAPVIISLFFITRKNFRQTLILSCLYLPTVILNLFFAATRPSLILHPWNFSLNWEQIYFQYTYSFGSYFLQPFVELWIAILLLGLLAISLEIFRQRSSVIGRKKAIGSLVALGCFYFSYLVVPSFFTEFNWFAASRKLLWLQLPVVIYAGIAFERLYRYSQKIGLPVTLLCTCFLCYKAAQYNQQPSYSLAHKLVLGFIESTRVSSSRNMPLVALCQLPKDYLDETTRPETHLHRIALFFRLEGWKVLRDQCSPVSADLRIYAFREAEISPPELEKLVPTCQERVNYYWLNQYVATLCLVR